MHRFAAWHPRVCFAPEDDLGGGEAPAPFTLADDALIVPPGGGDPVKFADWHKGYAPRGDFDKERDAWTKEKTAWEGRKSQAEQELINEARRLEQMLQQQARARQTPTDDPLAQVRSAAFVDGGTLAGLYERMQKEGIGPLQQWGGQMNQIITALHGEVQQLKERLGGFDRDRDNQKLNNWVTKLATDHGLDPENPTVRRQIENYYYSHEPEKGQPRSVLFDELPKVIGEDLEALAKLIRAKDKADADKARLARLPSRGGGVSPGGSGKWKRLTPRERAREAAEAGIFDRRSRRAEDT